MTKTSQIPIPGYIVETSALRKPQVFFTDANLLTARRSAMTFIEQLLTHLWVQDDMTSNVKLLLVETNPAAPTVSPLLVATVYQRNISQLVPPTDPSNPIVDPLGPGHPDAWQRALGELNEEHWYYARNGQSTGIGYFNVGLHRHSDDRLIETLWTLADGFVYAHDLEQSYWGQKDIATSARWYLMSTFYSIPTVVS